ncbi:hypothetical protein VSX64_20315 [Aurantimonas sp. C2-6-R+9]|nr:MULTISPECIES: hypothetical protein [unclassified Aurantimonas]MEC5293012.1 hypothetical protein [Aurantimonas sp. C2-3-R2]MEC5383173.1 hypothetical protein [Aurantimonas sp. C2-6-R+9]MEC5414066.1 hypothetical protein [Aurantimonas sp. C2-4-R8]
MSIEENSIKQFADLFVFIGIFAISIYAGGYSYITSYNEYFDLPVITDPTSIGAAVLFASNVLFTGVNYIFTTFLIVIITFAYVICRYVIASWIGFLVITFLFYASFLACAEVGAFYGNREAEKDTLKFDITKPVIKFPDTGKLSIYNTGEYHLLLLTEDRFFIFTPTSIRGVVQIVAIERRGVERYEVTLR